MAAVAMAYCLNEIGPGYGSDIGLFKVRQGL